MVVVVEIWVVEGVWVSMVVVDVGNGGGVGDCGC